MGSSKLYSKNFNTRVTPQSQKIPGSTQVPNSAGGFSWSVDDWERLNRFLILGTEGGSYYASERKLTVENAESVLRAIKNDGKRAVDAIVQVSDSGRAPKNTPALFALAMAGGLGDADTRRYALQSLPKVARIGTHLFQFAEALQGFRGWGRGARRAIANWYESKTPEQLAHQLVKYPQREGWSHGDLLRLSHASAPTASHRVLYDWATPGKGFDGKELKDLLEFPGLSLLIGQELLKEARSIEEVAELVSEYRLPREAIQSANTEWLNSVEVWDALLRQGMPMEAMIRNLGVMTARGLLKPLSDASKLVVGALSDQERITKSRLHPIKILTALLTYQAGHGNLGKLSWTPNQRIVDALDKAFYMAFGNVESTGKRIMLALDVSGSMDGGTVAGVQGLTPRVAAAAMALVTANREPNHVITAFQTRMIPLNVSPRQRLDDVLRATARLPFGGTDCAQPMLYALSNGLKVDTFVILTDSETWAGSMHPSQALRKYREKTGIPAKLVVVGMVSNGFTIADPNDSGMLDVVGFDTATPQLISEFSKGL